MTYAEKSVAVVMADPALRELLVEALELEGYASTVLEATPTLPQELARLAPHALVLDIGRAGERLAVLDALRSLPETSRTPLITLGTQPASQVEAQASGNVHTALPMPFDLMELLAALEAAVSHRPAEARLLEQPVEPVEIYHEAADLLTRAERSLMLRWLQEARSVPPFAERPDLSPQLFLDAFPRILNLIVLALRHHAPAQAEALSALDEARGRIERHAAERYHIGLPIEITVYEYQVLREIIGEELRRHLSADATLTVLGKVHRLLDDATRIAVASYHRLALTEPPAQS
ncbi:MAG TPA: hypothetical protein VGW38_28200 [Chloroflexota bacterium]|nr:hypothetical protein [Chloroflexota bacterium]